MRAGIDRTHSQGSNMSGLGGPMESVGEDQEMKGSDWASAMRILHDMEADQNRDRDRCHPPGRLAAAAHAQVITGHLHAQLSRLGQNA